MKFVLLSQAFYDKYSECEEILKKKDRPYCVMILQIENNTIAIPLRSHIKHKYAFFTNKEALAGLDYTKSVIINLDTDIDATRKAFVRKDEYKNILGREYAIKQGLLKFIKRYKKALLRPDLPENRYIVQNTALQYFQEYLVEIE